MPEALLGRFSSAGERFDIPRNGNPLPRKEHPLSPESKLFRYEAALEWSGDRSATATANARPALEIGPPSDFPGGADVHWSPEHLYLAAIASCTMLSFLAHCAHNGIEVIAYRSSAEGELTRRGSDQRYAFVRVRMAVDAHVAGGHAGAARGLTAKAERDCFISASTSAEVETRWQIAE